MSQEPACGGGHGIRHDWVCCLVDDSQPYHGRLSLSQLMLYADVIRNFWKRRMPRTTMGKGPGSKAVLMEVSWHGARK